MGDQCGFQVVFLLWDKTVPQYVATSAITHISQSIFTSAATCNQFLYCITQMICHRWPLIVGSKIGVI